MTDAYHRHTHRGVPVLVHRHDSGQGPHGHPAVSFDGHGRVRTSTTPDPNGPREPGEACPLEDLGSEMDVAAFNLGATWPLHWGKPCESA